MLKNRRNFVESIHYFQKSIEADQGKTQNYWVGLADARV